MGKERIRAQKKARVFEGFMISFSKIFRFTGGKNYEDRILKKALTDNQ
jgi:hypothetical protein